jgi:hypothetical protein
LYQKVFGKATLQSYAIPNLYFIDSDSLKSFASWGTVTFVNIESLPKHPTYEKYSDQEREELKSWVKKAIETSVAKVVSDMKLKE